MHILPSVIHSVFPTFTSKFLPTGETCQKLTPGRDDCEACPVWIDSIDKCGLNRYQNPDYLASLDAYFELYPEHAI